MVTLSRLGMHQLKNWLNIDTYYKTNNMKTDWPLFWAVIWKTYKYHMGMAILIFFGYLWNELVPSEDHYSLWYTHGPISLIIPLLVVVPMILMISHSIKHYKSIRKYYPDGYVNRKNKNK